MRPRQILLYGLAVTALMTALLVTDAVPAMVVAFFAMGLGMILSYYIALSQKRGNIIGEIETQNRILEKIQSEIETKGALRQLCTWTSWLVRSEDSLLWLEGSGVIAETTPGSGADWVTLAEGIDYKSQVFQMDKQMAASQKEAPVSRDWEEMLVVNDCMRDGRRLALFLINPQQKAVQDAILFRILHDTRYLLERSMGSRGVIDEYKMLVNIAVNGTELGDTAFTGHGERVQRVAMLLGRRLRLQEEEMKILEYASLLHDIGKAAGIEEEGAGRTDEPEPGDTDIDLEQAVPKDHASRGAELIPENDWWLQVKEAVKYHHERYDGSGYPEGLTQYDIPLCARIIAVADVYDALTVLAPEEECLDAAAAVAAIKKATGIWFDPLVVVALEEESAALVGDRTP